MSEERTSENKDCIFSAIDITDSYNLLANKPKDSYTLISIMLAHYVNNLLRIRNPKTEEAVDADDILSGICTIRDILEYAEAEPLNKVLKEYDDEDTALTHNLYHKICDGGIIMSEERTIINDSINHPSHYTDGKYETIDFIEQYCLPFELANTVKYCSRAGKKDTTKFKEDLEKALWYLNRFIKDPEKYEDKFYANYRFACNSIDWNNPNSKYYPSIPAEEYAKDKHLAPDVANVVLAISEWCLFTSTANPILAYLALRNAAENLTRFIEHLTEIEKEERKGWRDIPVKEFLEETKETLPVRAWNAVARSEFCNKTIGDIWNDIHLNKSLKLKKYKNYFGKASIEALSKALDCYAIE